MKRARRWAFGCAAAGFCIVVIVVRVVVSAHSEWKNAHVALAAGDTDEAIVRLRRTARWYAPGNPYVRRALDELETLAASAEKTGDARTARLAWEAERSALLGTRSFFTPYPDRLALANRHIAVLLARQGEPNETKMRQQEQRYLALLAKDDAPRVPWTLLALGGFGLFVGGAFLFIYSGIDANDKLRPRAALWSAIVILIGFSAFLMGLAHA